MEVSYIVAREPVIDLSRLSLDGEILDMGYEGKGIIYRAIRQKEQYESCNEAAVTIDSINDIEECSWVHGRPTSLPFEDRRFDAVTAFFCLPYIRTRNGRAKVFREIARVLKDDGKLYIWDMNTNFWNINPKTKVKVILPANGVENIKLSKARWFTSYSLNTIADAVEKYFIINERKIDGRYFNIEAVKRDDII